jgi:hypothetical protein
MKLRLLPALLLASSTLLAAPAFAQESESECSVDADCPMDYSCQEIGAYACASPPPCLEDDLECQMSRDNEPDCNSGVIMGCVAPPPAQCDPSAGASACGAGLTCLTYTYEQCSGGGYTGVDGGPVTCTVDPEGNESCTEPEPDGPIEEPMCSTESESYCVPEYFAPCQVDADCGGGFSCVDEPAQCDVLCTDIAPAPCAEGEECPEPTSNCTETCDDAPGEKYCELQKVECVSDMDCAGDLKCQQIETYDVPPSVCQAGGSTDPDGGDSDDEDERMGCEEPEPVVPTVENYCLPENWERWIGADGGAQGGGVDYDEAVADSTGREGGGENGSGDWKLVDKQAPEAPAQNEDGSTEEKAGGCQSARGGSPVGGLGLLAALGMMLGLRRRKK